ncbi:fumarylacetoacetate hydrolase family protein [uncultured Microbacterium sp.]|uniref:fumarylacetoacetate hydrolase family protein n=1 Tax=uncultured Microbacterium sp. TaxID=191216 RepID=UPI00260CA84A|nr:fumarylacetoacetate hydrolase family protein [uncultured Microbacterium sp.]
MTTPFSIVQYSTSDDPTVRLGFATDDGVRIPPAAFREMSALELMDAWESAAEDIAAVDPVGLTIVPDAVLTAPITFPRKVICAGANYFSHAAEMGSDRPDPNGEPFFFLKAPTTSIVGPDDAVVLDDPAHQLDWEAELGVVIGRRGKNIDVDAAMEHVGGYVVVNDLSARGLFHRPDAVDAPFTFDWVLAKSRDGFCPIGPGIVPAWNITDPHDLAIRLDVDGVVKQDSRTSDMVVRIPQLIAAASRLFTLEPGDLILTGTPAGVGKPRGDFLAAGSTVTVSIEGVGSISSRIVAPVLAAV